MAKRKKAGFTKQKPKRGSSGLIENTGMDQAQFEHLATYRLFKKVRTNGRPTSIAIDKAMLVRGLNGQNLRSDPFIVLPHSMHYLFRLNRY